MRETTKAVLRRYSDGAFHERYFVGHGIDIGAGDDSLGQFVGRFPRMESVRAWDISDGDAQFMGGVADESYDFVYSSHCLEHLVDPRTALLHWLRILKPGGYLVVSVPDEDLYERGQWPSRLNADHKFSFTIYRARSRLPRSINVVDLLRERGEDIECERMSQVRNFFCPEVTDQDQTMGAAECAIEWVWRKLPNTGLQLLKHALMLENRHRDEEAVAYYQQAIKASPGLFEAYNRLCLLLCRRGHRSEAAALWAQCEQALPDQHMPKVYRALFLMSCDQFDMGFRLRDRLVPDGRRTSVTPAVDYPRWQGQDLAGRSIVIWTEFGFGDELMFSRFARVFKEELGAIRVSLVCQAPILPVLQTLEHADKVVSSEALQDLPPHDYWVFPHSIAVHYSLDRHGVPASVPYLYPDATRVLDWHAQLSTCEARLKIGLVWKGNPTHENDHARSLGGLHVLERLFDLEGISWVSLQTGSTATQWDPYRHRDLSLVDVGETLDDFGDTAAVIAGLDLVICVDTAVAHLAGALGKPVWLLLPAFADWRWGLDRDVSNWYPTMRLFRQSRTGEWADVIHRVKNQLQALTEYSSDEARATIVLRSEAAAPTEF